MGRLGPRTLSSILDGGFEVVRYRFATIAILTVCIVVPLSAVPNVLSILRVTQALDGGSSVPAAELGIGPSTNSESALWLISIIGSSLSLALLGVGVAHLAGGWLMGRDPTARDALRVVWRRGGVVLVAWFVALVCKALSALACGIGLLLTVPMFVVLSPIVAIEGLGPLASVARSWRLSSRRRAGTMILLVVASVLLTAAFQVIVTSVAGLIQSEVTGNAEWSWIVLSAISVGFSLFLAPVQAAWAVLAYFDLRVRSEGLDLEMTATDVFAGSR
jgi:hypothetical protein